MIPLACCTWHLYSGGSRPRGSPWGETLAWSRSSLRALDMWRKPLVLVSGHGAGSSLSPRKSSDGCITHWLGSSHEWPPCQRSVEWSPSHVAHQLPGDPGHVSSTQTLQTPDLRDHHVLVRADVLSRQRLRPEEWMLHPEVGKQIWRVWGQTPVDLFATRQTSHCLL